MDPARWRRVEEIYQAATERKPEERAAFLAAACAGDEDLRREVESLLAHVLVHEIVHILQGCTRHSDRGVMKAHWNGVDFAQMLWGELPIAQEDIDLVHAGIGKRAQLAAAQGREIEPTGAGFAML